ncbi:protein Atossa [Musca vetustissima]|uniref:protein Atossa n=1 Tax=Musca vetustissima TaxID=27455 RepID=UPI002AB6714F|nr:protein Atossa [Musca vetustissima]
MIPTSFSGSSPPTAVVVGLSNNNAAAASPFAATGGGGGAQTTPNNACNSALLGIASLILEGRALAEDEYAAKCQDAINSLTIGANNTLNDVGSGGIGSGAGVCGRQSPKPSTSRAVTGIYHHQQEHHLHGGSGTSSSSELANYLRRKASNSPDSAAQSSSLRLRDYYSNSSSESAGSSVESNHSRWSQKLSQLRQESPCAQRQQMTTAEQAVAVDCGVRSAEPEYVALAINTTDQSHDERRSSGAGDFEIIRRIALNRMNLYNSPPNSSGGGAGGGLLSGGVGGSHGAIDNSLCSLQSLASNTWLRVGTPVTASTPKYTHYRITPQNIPRFPTPQHTDLSGSSANSSSGGGCGTSNCYNSPTPSFFTATAAAAHNKDYLQRKSANMPTPQSTPTNSSSSTNSLYDNSPYGGFHHQHQRHLFERRECSASNKPPTTATTSRNSSTTATTTTPPQQGPHCDQFLRKMGLAKGDASDAEEHHCDMSYVNITCTRWRAYCIKIENILARGEPICIEVYLGPVGHKILLEQWIISVNDKQPPPTMTLPSLCSAIRSQLYFSQISAWCDLIKKADKTIYDTGRLIYTTTTSSSRQSAAGDLATTTTATMNVSTILAAMSSNCGTSTTNANNSTNHQRPPRLNIFYRIKAYDEAGGDSSTACFNTKPNVHNFPNVNVSENCSLSVCLKSLPRITGGIPKINNNNTATVSPTTTTISPPNKATEAAASSCSGSWSSSSTMSATTSTTNQQQQTAVFNASYLNKGNPNIDDNSCSFSSCYSASTTNHHDFQKFCTTTTNNDSLDGDSFNSGGGAGACGDSCDLSGSAGFGEGDSSNSSLSTNYANLSHREKQLLKYRKRMLKRDKKNHQQQQQQTQQVQQSKTSDGSMAMENSKCCTVISQRMEQGDDDEDYDVDCCDDGVNNDHDDRIECQQNSSSPPSSLKCLKDPQATATKGQRQQQQQQLPNSFKNSIPSGNGQQQQHVKMISTGTQTISITPTNHHAAVPAAASPIDSLQQQGSILTCSACGYEKSMICLKCNPLKGSPHNVPHHNVEEDEQDDEDDGMLDLAAVSTPNSSRSTSSTPSASSSASSLNSSDIIQTPRNKAELLLQAIQRTPKANKKLKVTKDLGIGAGHQNKQQQQKQPSERKSTINNKNNAGGQQQNHHRSQISQLQSCQVCKRQKTQHHFQQQQQQQHQPTSSPSASSALHDINISDNNQTIIAENNSCQNSFSSSSSSSSRSPSTSFGNMVADNQMNGGGSPTGAADDILDTDADNEKDGGKMSTTTLTSEDCVDNIRHAVKNAKAEEAEICDNKLMIDNYKEHYPQYLEEEYFVSSTKLTPNIERCSLTTNNKSYYTQLPENRTGGDGQSSTNATDNNSAVQQRLCYTPPMMLEYSSESSKGPGGQVMAQFKTPTASEQQLKLDVKRQVQQQPHKQTPKPSLLQIAFNFNVNGNVAEKQNSGECNNQHPSSSSIHNPLLARRNSPKVNLTRIFCNPTEMKASSPIPIGNGGNSSSSSNTATTSPTVGGGPPIQCSGSKSAGIHGSDKLAAAPTFSFETPSSGPATQPPHPPPLITVQKSNSAPTLPNSPSLSPRFIKASALYKRRSRHLSDRSDRSSLGSDEQFSDEDLDCGMYSPFATSPVKLRSRLAAVFGRKPILGNLEESLLQRRLVPKIEVMGFKLLLGASGGFCPTQLTIPAAAYFYELQGETLSTPYLCEIRLPRKGYSVPRCGTVQATLLNPMGTVVRMFVIPYDMRDMPALHQTFIRQRILADTGSSNNTQTTTTTTTLNSVGSSDIMVQNGNMENNSGNDGGDGVTINSNKQQHHNIGLNNNNNNNNTSNGNNNNNLENEMGHFMSAENMKSLRYSIHLRFQTSRSGRLMLHTDIRLLISRRTDCDTAAAHAKGVLEAPNELITKTVMPTNPKYSARHDQTASNKI